MKRAVVMIMVLAVAGLVSGCGTPNMTNTKRTGIERLVISSAAERAIEKIEGSW